MIHYPPDSYWREMGGQEWQYLFSPLPLDPRGIHKAISRLVCKCGLSPICYLEKVSGYIGNPQPGSSMFNFGRSAGWVEMAFIATGVVPVLVTPQAWQRGLGLRTRSKGESNTCWKGYLASKAQAHFPKLRVTRQTADALLIAFYCRLKENTNASVTE